MSALNLEYDLFSSTGVPLRAKASVTIKEQMPQFDAKLAWPGANTGSAATAAVPPRARARHPRRRAPRRDRTGTALGGEPAADFATRMGLDPSTWKTFAAGISDPLSLDAGLQIDFSSSASASAGIGVEVGATATGTGASAPRRGAAGRPLVARSCPAPAARLTAAGGWPRAHPGRGHAAIAASRHQPVRRRGGHGARAAFAAGDAGRHGRRPPQRPRRRPGGGASPVPR